MILRRQLPLVRLDTLQDKFEGLHGRNYAAAWHESHKHMLTAAGYSGAISIDEYATRMTSWSLDSEKRVRKSSYISSWTYGQESEAMWRIYGAEPASIAIVTPYHRLRDPLNDFTMFIGLVNYFDYERRIIEGNTLWPIMFRRREFTGSPI